MEQIGRARKRTGPARDYTNIGQVSAPAFARLPDPGSVFAIRSARLAQLAQGNPLAAYLEFLSRLVRVQHDVLQALPPASTYGEAAIAGEDFARTMDWFLRDAARLGGPEAADQARRRLQALPWSARLALAEAVMQGAYPAEQLGECLFAAAALQVHLTRLAASFDAARLRPANNGGCPVCGAGPVASLIVGWAAADRSRYCCCSLCSSLWNYVRIKCTSCSSTTGVSYFFIEGQSKDVAAETCTGCGHYIKHLHQHRKPEIEPFADDLASFALDMLVREQNFRRATANPLLVVF